MRKFTTTHPHVLLEDIAAGRLSPEDGADAVRRIRETMMERRPPAAPPAMWQVTDDNHVAMFVTAASESEAVEKGRAFLAAFVGEDCDEEAELLVAYEVREGALLDHDGPVSFYSER